MLVTRIGDPRAEALFATAAEPFAAVAAGMAKRKARRGVAGDDSNSARVGEGTGGRGRKLQK